MLKRSGSEQLNLSKRIKTDNDMPPPSFVPRHPSTSKNDQKSSAQLPSSSNIKIKLQTSIKDVKSNNNGYFSDDEEEDEELWFRASQIEEREMQSHQKHPTDMTEISYSEFHDAEGMTSTQNDFSSQMDATTSQKIRVLQNKCAALEKQLKRNLPNIAKAQAVATQANCQINDLKNKIKKLQAENEELKKDKLNDTDRVSAATSTIRGENDSLRNQVMELNKKVRESKFEKSLVDKSPIDPAEVELLRFMEMAFDENQFSHFRGLISEAMAFKNMKFDVGNVGSKFHSQLVELQMTVAEMQGNLGRNGWSWNGKFGNLEKWQKNSENCPKSSEKWPKNLERSENWPKSSENWSKNPENWPKSSKNSENWPKSSKNPENWPKSSKNPGNWPKSSENWQKNSENWQKSSKNPENFSNFSENPKISLNPLQTFNNSRFNDKTDFNASKMFNKISKIFFEISADIKSSGLRHLDEHFVRKEFAYKQAQYCSDQYYGELKNAQKLSKIDKLLGFTDTKNPLTKSDKIFFDEIRVDHRRLIGIISQILSQSSVLSEMIMTQNISTNAGEYKTVIDLICDIIDPHILQSRFLYKNSGITAAFVDLMKNLSIHYQHFRTNFRILNGNFQKLFSHLLAMSTNNPLILLNFSEFLINILSTKNGAKMLKDLCKDFPSSNLEYSSMFKIYQIPRCGCMLQIFFILLTTAFRFIENVPEHNLDVLLELTENFNTIVFLIIANGCDVKFLKATEIDASEIKNHCKCYMFLVLALIILNNQVLKHRNIENNKYHLKISSIAKSAVVTLVALLSYTGLSIDYRSFTFGYNAISEIFTWITCGNIYVENCEKLYNCKNLLLTQDSHEKFLDQIITSTSNDYSYSFITCDSNVEDHEMDERPNEDKDNLWTEIMNDFRADESDIVRISFPK